MFMYGDTLSFFVIVSRWLQCTFMITRRLSVLVNFYIFDFSEADEQNFTKCYRHQVLNVLLYQLYVFGPIGKKDDRPCLWLAETVPTSLQPLNGLQRNLTDSRYSTFSSKLKEMEQRWCSVLALGLRSKMSRVRFPVSPQRLQRLVISCVQVAIWLKYRQKRR